MRARRAVLAMVAVLGLPAVTAPLPAQEPAQRLLQEQQMMRLQEQTARMTEAMQRMTRIQERAHALEQHMLQTMARAWEHEGAQEAVRLQHQEQLQQMAHAMSDGARSMHQAMEQFRSMLGELGPNPDAAMVREFERLRDHWEEMAGRMEEGLALMERLRDRLGQPDAS